MRKMGLSDVRLDEHGYLYARLPASTGLEHLPTLGWIAHMDTSPAVSGKDVKPQIVKYDGGDIVLKNGAVTKLSLYPFLSKYIGKELIVTDGTTLLGADDKAGVAEILSACAYLLEHPEIKHRAIAVAFTPDEEIGRGADRFDVAGFGAATAYTVDGGEQGDIEYENFNAASAKLTVTGLNIHSGSAKGRMKNAILMAQDFLAGLPADEIPAKTEGYEGFYHVMDIVGSESATSVSLLVRDHDFARFEERKAFLQNLTNKLNGVWGDGSFEIEIKDSYYNMKEKILPHMELIENAKRAMETVGAEPTILPIRGGTDGARLSLMGLPCPNLSTGGMNFHGIHEMIPVESMQKMVEVLVSLARM
jgi:tripeptide aminopeptidase